MCPVLIKQHESVLSAPLLKMLLSIFRLMQGPPQGYGGPPQGQYPQQVGKA